MSKGFFREVDISGIDGPRIKVPARCKIAGCAEQEEGSRYGGLYCVTVVPIPGEAGVFLAASDGRQLTVAEVEAVDVSCRFLLPQEAFEKSLTKSSVIGLDFERGVWRRKIGDQIQVGEFGSGRVPDFSRIAPDSDDMDRLRLALCSGLLERVGRVLFDQLGDERYPATLYFKDSESATLIDGDAGFSVVMPKTLEDAAGPGRLKSKIERFRAAWSAAKDWEKPK